MLNIYYVWLDAFTIYAWVKSSEDKETQTVLHGFVEIVN